MWLARAAVFPSLHALVVDVLSAPPARKMAFILDPSSVNEIYQLDQAFGMQVLEIVVSMFRTYAYGLHRTI